MPTVTDRAVIRRLFVYCTDLSGLISHIDRSAIDLEGPCRPRSIHEIHQFKLSAVLHVVPLTLSGDRGDRTPWRVDPRPHADPLQGTYAYLGVGEFWRRTVDWNS